jgi:tetrapyrrole methylase family protein / MazG family protein
VTVRVRVVGLGPGGPDLVTPRAHRLIATAPVARLRTRVHPAAAAFAEVESYDDWYERAESFEALYDDIARDLVALAEGSANGEVVYAVPGSPVVAERTVELLRARHDVETICEPAVSVIDLACATLGRDPMAAGLRVVDALAASEPLRGPGPLLVLQAYSVAVLAQVADRLDPSCVVTVLHHLGLGDERVVELPAGRLTSFGAVDHLTSLWIDGLRTAGEATEDLVDFTRRLRRECAWDREQSHATLTRHLLEEAYEALDALESLVAAQSEGDGVNEAASHVEEELGDLLFQVAFHAELGDEESLFNFATIADGVRDKLTGRHPHVFGDAVVADAGEVADRWESLKRAEKGRESVTEGIAWQTPSLVLYDQLLRKAAHVLGPEAGLEALAARAAAAVAALADARGPLGSEARDARWGEALAALARAARAAGADLEGALRERAKQLRDDIVAAEGRVSGAD